MIKRIADMAAYSRNHDVRPEPTPVEYDPWDLCFPEVITTARRLKAYMLGQRVQLEPNQRFTGRMRFDGTVPADIFQRTGHVHWPEVRDAFYLKPVDNLITFEWQHCVADFGRMVKEGIEGLLARIEASRGVHACNQDALDFLEALRIVCEGVVGWSEKCAEHCLELAAAESDAARRADLMEMAEICRRVPAKPARTFREGLQCVYTCFAFLPDSFGTIDRYLLELYRADIAQGRITRDEAKEFLQEFFLMVDSCTPYNAGGNRCNYGGESHFAVGGFTEDCEDGCSELTMLVLEALMELPTYRPQVSFRWTPKLPFETFLRVLDMERNDENKRIALINDVPRIQGLVQNAGIEWKDAVNYSTCGCNEPALQGGIWFGGASVNIVRCLENTLYRRRDDVLGCRSFDEFYKIFERELAADFHEFIDIADKFNAARARDNSVLSCLLLHGCVERARSVTRGGAMAIMGPTLQGTVCLIDSLTVIRQFVFDEKSVSMQELLQALSDDWEGHEALRQRILKKAKFFGNDEEISNQMAQRLSTSLWELATSRKGLFGVPILYGTQAGYNPHYAWFGARTAATPDGRRRGEAFMVGIGQTAGKDREGLCALLNSVAQADPHNILTGPYVCNINVDPVLVRDDEQFVKTARLIETYFRSGGIQLQLNYVKPEDLAAAKADPDKYKSLRVRVSGYSAHFVLLCEEIQDNLIQRTLTR